MDVSEIAAEFSLTVEMAMQMAERVKDAATHQILTNWRNEAKKGLKSSRRRYMNGLQIVEEGRLKNAIVLKGSLNNMLESGISSYDMKVGFSKSSKVKRTKDGNWYLTIPFRHSTTGSLGESDAFSNEMPKEITKLARNKARGGTPSGLTAKDIPSSFRTKGTSSSGYKHKSMIHEGLKRTSSIDEEKSGTYVTFRRVSSKSDQRAFIHPGFKARNFAEKALKNPNIETVIDNIIDDFIKNNT